MNDTANLGQHIHTSISLAKNTQTSEHNIKTDQFATVRSAVKHLILAVTWMPLHANHLPQAQVKTKPTPHCTCRPQQDTAKTAQDLPKEQHKELEELMLPQNSADPNLMDHRWHVIEKLRS